MARSWHACFVRASRFRGNKKPIREDGLCRNLLLFNEMGRPTGLEPATPRFTILCSNQLSYYRRKSKERGLSRPLKVLSTRFPVVSGRHAAKTVPRVNAAPAPRNVQYRARAGANPDPGAHLAAQASRKSEADRGPPRQARGHPGGLQGVEERPGGAGRLHHLDYLRTHAGFPHAAFGINNRRAGLVNLSYGNAILSRFPINETETIAFGKRKLGEKGFLFVEINVGGRIVPLVNLHLHFGSRRRRLVQLDHLVTWLKGKERERGRAWSVPPIVCGDLNNPDTRDDATAALLIHLTDYGDYTLHPQTGRTFPSPLPRRALDFVFIPPGCRMVHSEVVRSFLSDHRPVMVEFSVA